MQRHLALLVRCLLLLACGVAASSQAWAEPASAPIEDARAPSAAELLALAFRKRFEVDTISTVELVMRDRGGQERRRTFQTVSKFIDDHMHGIGRLVVPAELRGFTVLVIERESGGHDAFVYLPSVGRARRISTAQRADSFLGSDLTYEDFERQRAEDYELDPPAAEVVQGEPSWLIRARPRVPQSYHHADFLLARADAALLETRYYKTGARDPYRVILALREALFEADGHVLPKRLRVEDRQRGTSTEVFFRELSVNPPIDDSIFSVRTLEQKRELPVSHSSDG